LKRSKFIGTIILSLATIVVIAGIPISYFWVDTPKPSALSDDASEFETLGVRIEKSTVDGNWTVTVLQGRHTLSGVRIQIRDPVSGVYTVDFPLILGEMEDFRFIPYGAIDRGSIPIICARDIIILEASSYNIRAGYRFQLVFDEEFVIAGPKELP